MFLSWLRDRTGRASLASQRSNGAASRSRRPRCLPMVECLEQRLVLSTTDGLLDGGITGIISGGILDGGPLVLPTASTLQFSAANYTVRQTDGSALIDVTRTSADGPATVDYRILPAVGTRYADAVALSSGTLTFAPGEVDKAFAVPLLNARPFFGVEAVNLALSNPTGGATLGSPGGAILSIAGDAQAGKFQFGAAAYAIGADGGTATITVVRTGGSDGFVSVPYATAADGNAVPGRDYTPVQGALRFGPGETVKTFTVPVRSAGPGSGGGTVGLILRGPVSDPVGWATLGDQGVAVLTIQPTPAPTRQDSPAEQTFVQPPAVPPSLGLRHHHGHGHPEHHVHQAHHGHTTHHVHHP